MTNRDRKTATRIASYILVIGVISALAQAHAQDTIAARPGTSYWAAQIGSEYGPTFRGMTPTRSRANFLLDAEYSWFGFSGGLLETFGATKATSQTELFTSYSYPLGWWDISAGAAGFVNNDTDHRDAFEIFVEGRSEPICGLNLYGGEFFDATHNTSYSEIKVSHRFSIHQGIVEPYALFSFGDTYSPTFDFNHAQFGLDGEFWVSKGISLGIYGGIVVPLGVATMPSQSSGPKVIGGFRVAWRF